MIPFDEEEDNDYILDEVDKYEEYDFSEYTSINILKLLAPALESSKYHKAGPRPTLNELQHLPKPSPTFLPTPPPWGTKVAVKTLLLPWP